MKQVTHIKWTGGTYEGHWAHGEILPVADWHESYDGHKAIVQTPSGRSITTFHRDKGCFVGKWIDATPGKSTLPKHLVTADTVVFRKGDLNTEVLLIKRKCDPHAGKWALPGGFVEEGEPTCSAAARELEEEAGIRVDVDDLKLVGVFDDTDRDVRGHIISVAWWTEIDIDSVKWRLQAGDDAADARWWYIDELPNLAFDHGDMIFKALCKYA